MKSIILAGGCFWCMESPYHETNGIIETIPGYTGGDTESPSYYEVASGKTGHYEAVKVLYDETSTSLEKILEIFWQQIDPTDRGGQFADRGPQYRTAVFYNNEEEREIITKSRDKLQTSGVFEKTIETEILPVKEFYPAEEYHHKYFLKEPEKYLNYKKGSGRENFIKHHWKK